MQLDDLSNKMAMVKPRSSDEFAGFWDRSLDNSETITRAIEFEGVLVGSISCFKAEGCDSIGYWIDRAAWGGGIATAALARFLSVVRVRPLLAVTASTNMGSRRVLEKCGFVCTGQRFAPESDRYLACQESTYMLE